MTQEIPTYPEDDEILAQLDDPMDVEAFANLMENAHSEGVSAADFVREQPNRTSRKIIRRLCLKDRKRWLKALVSSNSQETMNRLAEWLEELDSGGAVLKELKGMESVTDDHRDALRTRFPKSKHLK